MRRIAFVLALVLAACGGGDTDLPGTATTGSQGSTTSTTTAFSSSPVSTPEDSEQGELTDVRVGEHDGFVRVVFTFANLVPGYSVKHAEPPFVQDGSGEEVTVEGDGHIAVRLTARAHDEEGKSSAPAKIAAGAPLTEVVRLGDFEGVVNYVIGLTATRPFKVFTLSGPARLVIDIQA
jgi:hypothetical protein